MGPGVYFSPHEDLDLTKHPIHGRFDSGTGYINFVEPIPNKLPVLNFAFPSCSGLLYVNLAPGGGFSFSGTSSRVILEREGPFSGYNVRQRVEHPWWAVKEPG
jgi:hypothetical protein